MQESLKSEVFIFHGYVNNILIEKLFIGVQRQL